MSFKIGRNDPCPCGSGKKYKKCCLRKAVDPDYSNIEKIPDILKSLRKGARFKECIYPIKSDCSERIINAHSIQNNKILSKISDNGDVFMPCPKADNFEVFPSAPFKYGRKQASVFTGFCGLHDKEVFQPIEDHDFSGTNEQIFLYIYRAFAYEYHMKQEAVRMEQALFAKKPSIASDPERTINGKTAFEMSVSDFEEEKKLFDAAIINKDYGVLTSIVWEFDQFANFAASGAEAPSMDFDSRVIQDLRNTSNPVRHIYMSVFPENNKTYAIIAWFRAYDDIFASIGNRLRSLTEQEKKNYVNYSLPLITENIAIKPSSWDAWPQSAKDEFQQLMLGVGDLYESFGEKFDRFGNPSFDLFSL